MRNSGKTKEEVLRALEELEKGGNKYLLEGQAP
jgi:hypothetical protein